VGGGGVPLPLHQFELNAEGDGNRFIQEQLSFDMDSPFAHKLKPRLFPSSPSRPQPISQPTANLREAKLLFIPNGYIHRWAMSSPDLANKTR
jgi:hypothetical protein